MFYSHQLLARKAPLGQICEEILNPSVPMALRLSGILMGGVVIVYERKVKLLYDDVTRLLVEMNEAWKMKAVQDPTVLPKGKTQASEEILNPSVPMALRLSGILMGGVVIVYERKVKLLYDDVTRLLVEMNEAWKMKAVQDPTVLPKGKTQARREAVTLPENKEKDVGDIEQSLNFSNSTTTLGCHRTGFFAVRLDDVDEPDINNDPRNEDPFQLYHQADAENITLFERFDSYQTNMEFYNRYERFDIEGDEETQMNNTSGEPTQMPSTLVPSPPQKDSPQGGQQHVDRVQDQHPEREGNQQSDERAEAKQHEHEQTPRQVKRITRRPAVFMDNQQTIIPGHTYRSWFENVSDISSRRGRKRKACTNIMSRMKIAKLMDLPAVVLMDDMFSNGIQEIHYPAPLMELWIRSTQPLHGSPSARTLGAAAPEPSSMSPPDGLNSHDTMRYPFDDFHNGFGSPSMDVPMEKIRTGLVNDAVEILIDELKARRVANASSAPEDNVMATPLNSGGEMRSAGSTPEGSNKKRPYSSSKHSGSSLDPVAEETSMRHPDPTFKLSRLSEKDQTPDQELLVETGPTPTQYPVISQPVDKMTDTIRMHLKTHFETPGAPQVESLNHLAAGMNRKGAALLFYQTCVLASHDFLRVQQKMPYGDVLISKGPKL
ncbi:hypothetical protein SLEP1_g37336 [Rubroshorea leprosula]|uniref:Sister chromatid cohesion 1 protein 1 n=1 Tax=Rubroshorea leprosula TaxID=152421 RepID=A0AAV5KU95_9ROSI|nr:hypothetical protein SLEP1_g37336 [Rubroshorea leprosula]